MMPDWLGSITVGQVVGWLVAAGAILGGLRWLRPWADGLHAFLEDWQGTPERPGVDAVPGVMEKLRRMDGELREVKTSASAAAFNTGPNHGSSAHDVSSRSSVSVIFEYATRTANSGDDSPSPAA